MHDLFGRKQRVRKNVLQPHHLQKLLPYCPAQVHPMPHVRSRLDSRGRVGRPFCVVLLVRLHDHGRHWRRPRSSPTINATPMTAAIPQGGSGGTGIDFKKESMSQYKSSFSQENSGRCGKR